jgi:ketosteroid isomerase-like protein
MRETPLATFTIEETVSVAAINQLINDWVFELDFNHGVTIADLVTEDCSYPMASGFAQGRQAIVDAYRKRCDRLSSESDGVPPMRHLNANLRVSFVSPHEADITFGLLFFTAEGNPAGTRHTDAAAVADVWMNVRREDDGHWRIGRFESTQPFSRALP